jgi:hypothetical protein
MGGLIKQKKERKKELGLLSKMMMKKKKHLSFWPVIEHGSADSLNTG